MKHHTQLKHFFFIAKFSAKMSVEMNKPLMMRQSANVKNEAGTGAGLRW
jgi:hypothetical protein